MKEKRVVITIIVLVTVLLLVALFFLIGLRTHPTVMIEGHPQQKKANIFPLGELKVKSYSATVYSGTYFTPESEDALQELILNSPYYQGTIHTHISMMTLDGWLFCYDNNYYVLYPAKDSEKYVLSDLSSYCSIDGTTWRFAAPVGGGFTTSLLERYEQYEVDLPKDCLYDWITYEKAKQFYGACKEGYVTVDDENKIIFVTGYVESTGEACDYPNIVLDFEQQRLGYKASNGEIIYY